MRVPSDNGAGAPQAVAASFSFHFQVGESSVQFTRAFFRVTQLFRKQPLDGQSGDGVAIVHSIWRLNAGREWFAAQVQAMRRQRQEAAFMATPRGAHFGKAATEDTRPPNPKPEA